VLVFIAREGPKAKGTTPELIRAGYEGPVFSNAFFRDCAVTFANMAVFSGLRGRRRLVLPAR